MKLAENQRIASENLNLFKFLLQDSSCVLNVAPLADSK